MNELPGGHRVALMVLPGSERGLGGAFAVSGSAAADEQIHSKFTANAYLLVGVTVGVKFNFCTRKR